MADWLTAASETLADLWPDASALDQDSVDLYLGAAKDACLAYAPALAQGVTEIPDGWVIAQAMQARNIFNAGMNDDGGDVDGGGFGIAVHPLDWHVQQLLRPKRGRGPIL